jgi:hypothetical protein
MIQACSGGKLKDNRSSGNMSSGVYKAINAVQAALAKTGISKNRTNTQGSGYKFRGIDDVFNALSPLLAEYGLCILPRMTERSCEERQSKSGGALFYTTVKAEFDFVCAEDGSKHTVVTYGEAMDSGDKSTNKAMSAAYKYAAFQAFAIPTEGDNDADAHTPEVAARSETRARERADWLARQKTLIFGAANVGELKRIVSSAISIAMQESDGGAVDQINVWADEKKAQAKPKDQE